MYLYKPVLICLAIIAGMFTLSCCFAEQVGITDDIIKDSEKNELSNQKQQFNNNLDKIQKTLDSHQNSINLQERQLENQSRIIELQKSRLEKQAEEIQSLRNQLLPQDQLEQQRATGNGASERTPPDSANQSGTSTNTPIAYEDKPKQTESPDPIKSTGTSDKDNKEQSEIRPEITAIADIGGVLTPRGKLVFEPAIQASHSSLNQFTFLGVEIIDAFLVGLIQAEDTDRDLVSSQLTARYGINNRLEVELKIPYVYRSDKVSGTIPQAQNTDNVATTVDRDFSGHGLGDIELALHYQLNNGLNGWPYFIGNLRWKTDTGQGPFDVDRDEFGKEAESATGSGFHSLEPSLTILYPSDPAVFFANIGYLINLKEDLDKTFIQTIESSGDVETQSFGRVDPGNSTRISFGMGYSINERSSLTLGYKHDFIKGTKFEINDSKTSTSDLDVGSLLLGWGFAVNPDLNINLNLELGITQDAPDVTLTLRVPFTAYKP